MIGRGLDIVEGAGYNSCQSCQAQAECEEVAGDQPRLAGVDLSGLTLKYFDLRGANLSQADLSGADMTSADLRGANLTEAAIPDGSIHA